jgi:hypothetical protein
MARKTYPGLIDYAGDAEDEEFVAGIPGNLMCCGQ